MVVFREWSTTTSGCPLKREHFSPDRLNEKWGDKHAAMVRFRRNGWEEFVPFLDYDVEIRTMICSANTIEPLNARYRRAVRVRGHVPTEQTAWTWLCLVTGSLDPAAQAGLEGRCGGNL